MATGYGWSFSSLGMIRPPTAGCPRTAQDHREPSFHESLELRGRVGGFLIAGVPLGPSDHPID